MKRTLKNNLITKTAATRLYNQSNPIIGLTGGIATGKSTVGKFLKQHGFFIIDADQLVKEIYQRPETLEFINQEFPHCVKNGEIDFKCLRQEAFTVPLAKEKIEKYIYQRMPQAFKEKAQTLKNSNEIIIYDVPLLFEKGLDKLVDQSICVYSTPDLQLQRLISRDNSTPELAKKILSHQMSIEEKKQKANWVIDNSSNLETLESNIETIFDLITEK